jgi:hypothetical protein
MTTFLEAMAREEGWLDPSSLCRRNHNPGNIEHGQFARAHGAIGNTGRFAYFPDDATGFAAMRALLQEPLYQGKTVEAAIAEWAPPDENDTPRYIANVCAWCGCHAGDVIDSLITA